MRISKLLENIEVVELHCDPDLEIDRICYDSRAVKPGCAFIAARRIGADGHDYIKNAAENGASVIIAEKVPESGAYIIVPDGNRALAAISANFYGNPAKNLTIIGVTGTKGKTTASFMIKNALEEAMGAKVGLIGTIGCYIGAELIAPSKNTTPEAPELHELFARMLSEGCTHVVMEVSSHSLDIGRVYGVQYAAAVFTNLSQDHLDYHITMENYLHAKSKLFNMTPIGVINVDDPAAQYIIDNTSSRKIRVSTVNNNADIYAVNINHSSFSGVEFDAAAGDERCHVSLASPGMFMVYNALSALGCCRALDIPFEKAAAAVSNTKAVPGRVQYINAGQDFRVIVDYAHTPESVKQMASTAREFTGGRLVCVFGCGGNRDRTKRPLMAVAAAESADYIVITTDNPRFEEPEDIIADIVPGMEGSGCEYKVVADRREAIRHALDMATSGDTVLIMGKGHEDYQEIRGVRSHFSDCEEAELYLKRGGGA